MSETFDAGDMTFPSATLGNIIPPDDWPDGFKVEFIDDENPRWRISSPQPNPEDVFYIAKEGIQSQPTRWERIRNWFRRQ